MTGARGYADYEGRRVILDGFIPGDEVSCGSLRPDKGFLRPVNAQLSSASELRISPACPYSGRCGGCDFDCVSEETSARLKNEIVAANISSALKRDVSPLMKDPLYASASGYRARCRIHLSAKDRQIGFLAKNSSSLVAVKHCPLLTDGLNEILADGRKFFSRAQSQIFSAPVNRKTGFAELSLFDAGDKVLAGSQEGVFSIAGYTFHLTGDVFFQSNIHLLPALFQIIRDEARGDSIMDLYSGVGTFSAVLEDRGCAVTAVERDKRCLALAAKNAPSARFFTDDVALWAARGRKSVDTVIVDPPRTGLKEAAKLIPQWKAGRIIYVSCNSATLAYDLKSLCESYEIESIQVIDFYPGSGHEETVVILNRKGEK